MSPTITIRPATPADLDIITMLESTCFPPAEAADRASLAARLATFSDRYLILFEDGRPVSYVGGMTTHETVLTDEMYADPTLHDPNGRIQMIFSVATLPAYRRRGYAALALRALINDCCAETAPVDSPRRREALVLTCKQALIHFYATLGFELEGRSASEHGGAEWYQMRLTLKPTIP